MLPRDYAAAQEKRKQQIDTLKIFNDNVSEVQENVEYSVEFTSNHAKMRIGVTLGPEFPFEKPLLHVDPSARHPWVADDSKTIVGAPGLINYTIHSDLGRVVQAIIREFEQRPPLLLDEVGTNSALSPSPFNATSPIQTAFPELQTMSIEELIILKDDEDMQDKFLETLPHISESNQHIKDLMDEIESLANENLAKREQLQELKESIVDRVESVADMKKNFEALGAEHSRLSEMYAPHSIMSALARSAVDADEEAEILAQEFLNGAIDCETFLRTYEVKRSLGHSRKTYHERLSHQLSQSRSAK